MILTKEQMHQAMKRIDELQQEVIDKADKIEGAKEYVEEQMRLFHEAEKHRKQLNMIMQQQEMVSKEFKRV